MPRSRSCFTSSGDNPPPPRDVEICTYQSNCTDYSSVKCRSCKNNTYKNKRKSYYEKL